MANYDPYFPVFSPHHTGTSRGAGLEKLNADPAKWSLYQAVSQCRLDVVEKYLSCPTRHDFQEIAGALRLAGQRGYVDIGRFLIQRTRVQPDVHCPDGYTPLILAVRAGHEEMAKMLIEQGADPAKAIYRTKVSALHWASVSGHPNCVELLIKSGAPVASLTLQHRTPLILAACYGHLDVVKTLIRAYKADDDVSAADANGMTALHMAVQGDYGMVADYLLSHSANIDAQNIQGYTPLLIAIEKKYSELAYRLIRAEANLELALRDCLVRPLHMALALDRHEIVTWLVEAGCSLVATCELVQSCCGSVLLHGQISCLHIAATGGDVDNFQKIVRKMSENSDFTANQAFSSTDDGFSPMMLGAAFGSCEMIEQLIESFQGIDADKYRFLTEISLAVVCACLRGRKYALLNILRRVGAQLPPPATHRNSEFMFKSRITLDMTEQLNGDGRLSEDVIGLLMAAGNCDQVLQSLLEILPGDETLAQCLSIKKRNPNRLEQCCVTTIRKALGAYFGPDFVVEKIQLPPSLIRSITLQHFDE